MLLGDSIFDNAAYTGSEPDVLHHLRSILPAGWKASQEGAFFLFVSRYKSGGHQIV